MIYQHSLKLIKMLNIFQGLFMVQGFQKNILLVKKTLNITIDFLLEAPRRDPARSAGPRRGDDALPP